MAGAGSATAATAARPTATLLGRICGATSSASGWPDGLADQPARSDQHRNFGIASRRLAGRSPQVFRGARRAERRRRRRRVILSLLPPLRQFQRSQREERVRRRAGVTEAFDGLLVVQDPCRVSRLSRQVSRQNRDTFSLAQPRHPARQFTVLPPAFPAPLTSATGTPARSPQPLAPLAAPAAAPAPPLPCRR